MAQLLSSIGEFAIGVDIAGKQPFDWTKTIYSQYANSPILLALIENFAKSIDMNKNIDDFYDLVWNVLTAQSYGLDVWGRIVGVNRLLNITTSGYFGFSESASAKPFDQAAFYSGQSLTSTYALSDPAFLLLVLAKAASNIWNGSIPGLNAILRLLFPGNNCYVIDGQNMTMTYSFNFVLTPVQVSIVLNSGVLPRPSGVSVSYINYR